MTFAEQLAAFKKAIEADKYDQTTRLVLADFLEEHGHDDEAMVQRKWTPEWQKAEDWMHDFASRSYESYEEVMRAANSGEVDLPHGDMTSTFSDLYDIEEEEFWKNWKIITGEEKENPDIFFACSC